MSLRCFTFALVVLPAMISVPARAAERKEFFLKYRLSANIDEEVGSGGQHLHLVSKKDRGNALPSLPVLKEEPKYHSEPLYGAIQLGASKERVAIVLDSSSGGKLGYDILYVDADRDGRITPLEKLMAGQRGQGTTFGPVKLLVDSGTEKCPQWFIFRLHAYKSGGQVQRSLSAVNTGFYQGVLTFGGHKRLVAVVDANGNGVYNDCMKGNHWNCDRLLIDVNNDGRLDGSFQSEEAQPLGRYVLVGDKYWKLDVAADGSSVFVEPLDKPLGTVRSEQKDYRVLVSGDEGVIRIRSRDGSARLPEGNYRLAQCLFSSTDKAGQRWQFSSVHAERGATLKVVAHKTVPLPLGPPFVPKVLVTQSAGALTLSLVLRGAAGEVYSDVQLGANQRPPVPKVRITDAAGRELSILDFHYG